LRSITVWDIPFERWLGASSPLKRRIAGGWQLFGILAIRSGTPNYVTSGRDNFGLGATSGQRADMVLGSSSYLDGYQETNTHTYLNRAAFADPCDLRGLRRPCGVYGNEGSFVLSNPGSATYALSLFKNIKLTERTSLQFRSEFFNALNRVNFGAPSTSLTSATFGQITSAGLPRELQFALKLLW